MKEGYLPLYRKYRPQKLEDIVGQAHIKRALTNAIELGKIAHAYLFTGPRGTGKTSTARILAKSLNCVNGPTVTPCEECESCKAITNTVPIDVIEIDAASNRSVEDAHEILEKVQYAPIHGKYKIYIIDEVHMLTTQAFNALLKTLEEPPKNVIFILATTEAHKVLDTIKSRCQRFDFKRITTSDIIEHLTKIAKKEGINITDEAISLIAKSSAGGMRDSLALLDQVSTMGADKAITETDINNLLGRLSFDSLVEICTNIINSDSVSAINSLEKIYNDGNEPVQILTNIMLFFKNLLIIKTCDKNSCAELTGLTSDQISVMKNLSDSLETHQIVFLINKSADYIREIKASNTQQMWLEVGLIDLANLAENTKLSELEARIARLEKGDTGAVISKPLNQILKPVIQKTEPIIESEIPKPMAEPEQKQEQDTQEEVKSSVQKALIDEPKTEIKPEPAQIDYSQYKNTDTLWMNILQALLKDNISALAKMKAMSTLSKFDENGIVIACKTPTIAENMNLPEKRKKLMEAIESVIGAQVPLIIRAKTEEDNISKVKLPQQKKTSIVPQVVQQEETEQETYDSEEILEKQKSVNSTEKDNSLSDQANMVKNLFDGKVLE